jgi:hypothetical protein
VRSHATTGRQGGRRLAQVLTPLAAEDRTFGREVARLVGQAEHDPALGAPATTIAGHPRVGKVVTIGHAGAIHVHLQTRPALAAILLPLGGGQENT